VSSLLIPGLRCLTLHPLDKQFPNDVTPDQAAVDAVNDHPLGGHLKRFVEQVMSAEEDDVPMGEPGEIVGKGAVAQPGTVSLTTSVQPATL
jgi:hypothetical protein